MYHIRWGFSGGFCNNDTFSLQRRKSVIPATGNHPVYNDLSWEMPSVRAPKTAQLLSVCKFFTWSSVTPLRLLSPPMHCHSWLQFFNIRMQIHADTQLQDIFQSFLEYSPLLLICGDSFANYRREKWEERERTEIAIFLTFGVGGSLYSHISHIYYNMPNLNININI